MTGRRRTHRPTWEEAIALAKKTDLTEDEALEELEMQWEYECDREFDEQREDGVR